MSLVRAFIAIDIPTPIQTAIDEQTQNLREQAGASLVRWVKPCNLHLTLKFLGEVSTANVQLLTQMLTTEVARYPSFEIELGRLGSFPTTRRPRVIWIGIQAPAVLETLQRAIESAAARLGYAAEERAFSPHLTIGRVRSNLAAAQLRLVQSALESHTVGSLGKAEVEAVHLIKSDLQPEGSVYTRLFSAALAASPQRIAD